MVAPTVHLSGTSAAALLEGYEAATAAVTAACNALRDAAPNARDYYPQGPDAWTKARDAYQDDLTALHNVLHHLQYLHESVCQQSEGIS